MKKKTIFGSKVAHLHFSMGHSFFSAVERGSHHTFTHSLILLAHAYISKGVRLMVDLFVYALRARAPARLLCDLVRWKATKIMHSTAREHQIMQTSHQYQRSIKWNGFWFNEINRNSLTSIPIVAVGSNQQQRRQQRRTHNMTHSCDVYTRIYFTQDTSYFSLTNVKPNKHMTKWTFMQRKN